MEDERVVNSDRPATAATQPTERRSLARNELAAIIEREYAGLRLLIARRVEDRQLAADLLQEAICTTWEKWQAGRIERPQLIAGYVFQVAMNLLRNHRRAMGARPDKRASVQELDGLPARDEPRDELMESEIAARVASLIRSMSPLRDRHLLVRFYLDEEDKQAICRDMHLNSLQFDKVLYRARRRLKELLETHGLNRSELFSVLIVIVMLTNWRM
jgi:RNA polymerase sigma-70 factor (ECF subfamily)